MDANFSWTVIMIFIIGSCSSRTQLPPINNDIKGYQIIHTISPSPGPGNSDLKRSDTEEAKIFFWQNQILYKSSHFNYYMKDGTNVDKVERQDFVFVRVIDSTNGYYFDLFRNQPVQKIGTDSFLRFEWYAQIRLYPIFLDSDQTLNSEKKYREEKQVEYQLKGKGADSNKTGTINLFYSNSIKDPRISLSKELDSINRMKLIRVKTITNSRKIEKDNIEFPKFEVGYSLEEIRNKEEIKEASNYFINYKRKE